MASTVASMRLFVVLPAFWASASALLMAPTAVIRTSQKVFIEDTDAYGVVYHANYLRFFERAATAECLGCGCIGLVSVDAMRYSTAAVLGDECTVECTPTSGDSSSCSAALIRTSDARELCSASGLRLAHLGHGFEATEKDARLEAELIPDVCNAPLLDPSGDSLRLHYDEASCAGSLSLHAAARYFERHRTTFLGGPTRLAELAAAGVNVVVARIKGLRLLPAAHEIAAGTPLELRCRLSLKARNTQVVFEQWLLDGNTLKPLARGDVVCLCISAESQKIIAVPQFLLHELQIWM